MPVEWFALSSGAKISMDSGTENMDWVARGAAPASSRSPRRGGEVNVVVAGINVGAQPYWNAEATMLMHTKGILVMTPDSAMVLTGKQALDYSGGVSAEDNFGIGGYDRIMGPNGAGAVLGARPRRRACDILFAHYEHTYVAPGERCPRRRDTDDPVDRDVRDVPAPRRRHRLHHGRRHLLRRHQPRAQEAVRHPHGDARGRSTRTTPPLERGPAWPTPRRPSSATRTSAGIPVTRDRHRVAADPAPRQRSRPTARTSGRPARCSRCSSKKMARAINAASGNRPVVVLANLSGFDGSPESLRKLQLEYGAEIGRAIVNFDGPIVFCVISRYHGGAFVVFSGALNDDMEVLAVEGSLRLGDRRGAGRGGGVHPRGRRSAPRPIRGCAALEAAAGRRPTGPSEARLRAELADAAGGGALGEAGRGGRRVRRDPQHRAGPRGGLGARDHPGRRAAPAADRRRGAGPAERRRRAGVERSRSSPSGRHRRTGARAMTRRWISLVPS